ncbi:MAG: glycosyltransferase [Okeania sp. SIO2F4]|uniref:glycosyltransferase family 4 protein n=1 Tax=Okeania sp. SIO2F4 TaxID=2607790 RepID=UPI00142C13C0|nr:glycosyltransferase [Okeania sp. SIO2F4]NES02125.1 glycosyltransferase [Okeania sp. SIO2F4]
MSKHYIFFTRRALPLPNIASQVQVAHSPNAAANLGYSTVLACISQGQDASNPVKWLRPFQPKKAEPKLVRAYNIQDKSKVVKLPIPWPIDTWGGKWTSVSTVVSKYYFRFHILAHAKIVHTRDGNFVEVAIKHGVPVIYEQHHHKDRKFDLKIVNSPLFPISITVADTVRESTIENGMPANKIIKLHNGFNIGFTQRQPEAAQKWREKLLKNNSQHLVVYSGGLYQFKGIDMLIDVAKELPQIQFAFAGGDESQVKTYQQQAIKKQANNVTFLGFLAQSELATLLQAADILAHPHCMTQAATFTSPLKFFDYLASGTPMIATEIPPLEEFKSSNVVAGWCEPDHPVAFSQCIQKVLLTNPRKEEGYIKSIEYAKEFSCENRISKIMSYVDESMRPEKIS